MLSRHLSTAALIKAPCNHTHYITILDYLPIINQSRHRRGKIFSIGTAKIERLLVGEAKIGEKQSRQSNSMYNLIQYALFEKKVYAVYNGAWGKPQQLLSLLLRFRRQ